MALPSFFLFNGSLVGVFDQLWGGFYYFLAKFMCLMLWGLRKFAP